MSNVIKTSISAISDMYDANGNGYPRVTTTIPLQV
jgi:hypothetical protein